MSTQAIRKIEPKIDLVQLYKKFENDPNEKMDYGFFTTGKFSKPVAVTIHGRVDEGIKTWVFNGGKTFDIGVKLDVEDEEAFQQLEDKLGEIVKRENNEAMADGDEESCWTVNKIVKDGVLPVKLKESRGKFKAKINKVMDPTNIPFISPNEKVTIHGNILWWANIQDGKIGASFSLISMHFE